MGLCSKCYQDQMDKSKEGLKSPASMDKGSASAGSSRITQEFLSQSTSQSRQVAATLAGINKAEQSSKIIASESSEADAKIATHDLKTVQTVASVSLSLQTEPDKKSVVKCENKTGLSESKTLIQKSSNDDNVADKTTNDSCSTATKEVPKSEEQSPEKRGIKRDSDVLDEPVRTPQKNKKRCFECGSKLELAQRQIGKCRCDYIFCSLHRLPELHNCIFDHKEDGRREAREKMVKPTRHLGTSFKRIDH